MTSRAKKKHDGIAIPKVEKKKFCGISRESMGEACGSLMLDQKLRDK